jgi:hypothetical protein
MARHVSHTAQKPQPHSKTRPAATLATELATFEAKLPALLQDAPGKFVVIKSREILGLADDYSRALRLGYSRLGSDKPFFVEQIQDPKISARRRRVFLTKVKLLKNG